MNLFFKLSIQFFLSIPGIDHCLAMDSLPTPMPPPLNKMQAHNWDAIDKTFQDGIILLAKKYGLGAEYVPLRKLVHGDMIVTFCSKTASPIPNPESHRQNTKVYNALKEHAPLPMGSYAEPQKCSPWMHGNINAPGPYRSQGIKLHVSAKPETALKIAQIVLPILQAHQVSYKVMYDLRLMRELYFLSQYSNPSYLVGTNQSTQAGKFIAIYPSSDEKGQEIIKALETAFHNHQLTPDDFVKLAGDAQIGDTGGIFGRYGKFNLSHSHKGRPGNNITPVNPLNESIPHELMGEMMVHYDPKFGLKDERFYPWPDYMNNRKLYNGLLFGDLNVTWVNPYNPEQIITWKDRPNCWAELKGEECQGNNRDVP